MRSIRRINLRNLIQQVRRNRADFTEVSCRPEGPERSKIDFGRKVNPTSVATAREAPRYLDPTETSVYIYTHSWARERLQFTAGKRYLPSWRVQAEENLVIKFVPAS